MLDSSEFQFDAISHFYRGIRLQCKYQCTVNGLMTALVQGIEIGSKQISKTFVVGDLMDLPIAYFPHVALPAVVRFAIEDTEIARPLLVNSSEEVMAMIGHGDIEIDNLILDNGLLRGAIVSRNNGLSSPNAYIRINNLVIRSVVVEPPRSREGGGAISMFAVPIRISDLSFSGLNIELHISGIDHPVASLAYTHATFLPAKEQLLKLEERVRQQSKSHAVQIDMLSNMLERRLVVQQERIDAFIEFALGILLNNPVHERSSDDIRAFIDALHQSGRLGNDACGNATAAEISRQSSFIVPLDSIGLAFGWHDIEMNDSGAFRWMAQTGLIRNPMPGRSLDRIELVVSHVYGVAQPMLSASVDDQPLDTEIKARGNSFLITFTRPANVADVLGSSVCIESFVSGCPATDTGTSDQRILSIAASHFEFHYRT